MRPKPKGKDQSGNHARDAERQHALRPGECDGRKDRAERDEGTAENTERQQRDRVLSRFGDTITLGFFRDLWRQPPLNAGQSARVRVCRQWLSYREGSGR